MNKQLEKEVCYDYTACYHKCNEGIESEFGI